MNNQQTRIQRIALQNDQKRVMRPTDAFAEGSNWLVIGRSITNGNIKKNIKNLLEILED